MNFTLQTKLPIIKKLSVQRKNTLSISKIEKSKSKLKIKGNESQRCHRKISLDSREIFNIEKRSLSRKRFSLKRISTEKTFKTLKLSQRNTDDNSESQKNCETFQEVKNNDLVTQSITERAVDLLKNMKQVDKISKLYKKDVKKTKHLQNNQQSKRILKTKYKCLVNPHVFVRKSKHNNSDEAKGANNKEKTLSLIGEDFWDKINESLILQSCQYEQPSKQLYDLVENIQTQV